MAWSGQFLPFLLLLPSSHLCPPTWLAAGITRDSLMMRMKPDQWQDVIDTNLSSVFFATQVRLRLVGQRQLLCPAAAVAGAILPRLQCGISMQQDMKLCPQRRCAERLCDSMCTCPVMWQA